MDAERFRRVDVLLEEALAREPRDRAAFLDGACVGDPPLRAEVESLLAAHDAAGDLLERPALELAAELLAGPPAGARAGQTLGTYTVEHLLGRGGMGEVYRARDPSLGRHIALKVLPPSVVADPARRRRFEREARAASALNHPNILTIHEIGETGGVPYIATEEVDGDTLRQALAHGPLPVDAALDVAIQVASALAAAHRAGIVHRDIKPENVMVRGDGYVKVLDFGLAKLDPGSHEDPVDPDRAASDDSALMGTARYMSPEQAWGRSVDARSDLFSLGVLLYEMVAGRRPFEADSSHAVLVQILEQEPPPLAGSAAALGAGARAELQRIVSRALAKQPGDRYQSARELQDDLERLRRGFEPRARAPRRWARVTAAAAAVAAGAALFALSARPSDPARDGAIPSVAVLPFVNQGADPELDYLADGLTEALIGRLSRLPGLEVTSRSSTFLFKGREADPREVGRGLGVAAVVSGRLAQRGDELSVTVELVDAGDGRRLWGVRHAGPPAQLLALEDALARDLGRALQPRGGERRAAAHPTENVEAYRLYLRGRYHWNKYTRAGFATSIGHFRAALELDPAYALAWAGLADAYSIQAADLIAAPSDVMPKARAAARRAVDIDGRLAEAQLSLGIVQLFYDRDWSGAERTLDRARTLDPRSADARHFYGHYLEAVGRTEEAVAETRRGLELDPLSLILHAELAWALYYAGRDDEAIAHCRKVFEMEPDFVFASWTIASPLVLAGRQREAIAELERARRTAPTWPALTAELAYARAASGDGAGARALVAELERQAAGEYVDAALIAPIHVALADRDAAMASLERAYQERSPLLVFVAVERKFAPLHADPRFADLLRRMGLSLRR